MDIERRTRGTGLRAGFAASYVVAALVVAAVIGILALALNRPAGTPGSGAIGLVAGAPSCDREWQATLVTCDEARRSISTGMAPLTAVHIWLTTLGAVDSQFQPSRQVADHPADPATPVWLFIYEGDQVPIEHRDESGTIVQAPPEGKLLHVTNANDRATTGGAFIYVYLWAELGAPPMPVLLPSPTRQ